MRLKTALFFIFTLAIITARSAQANVDGTRTLRLTCPAVPFKGYSEIAFIVPNVPIRNGASTASQEVKSLRSREMYQFNVTLTPSGGEYSLAVQQVGLSAGGEWNFRFTMGDLQIGAVYPGVRHGFNRDSTMASRECNVVFE